MLILHSMENRRKIEVVAAVIRKDGRIFATQRGYGEFKDKWEFPGGKIEPGESREEALAREIREELDAEIRIERHICTVDYDYPAFHITLHCFLCSLGSGAPVLKEHESARWLGADGLDTVDWLPADMDVIRRIKEEFFYIFVS